MFIFILTVIMCLSVCVFIFKLTIIALKREQIKLKTSSEMDLWPKVSIVIPARNEEENIKKSLGSLVKQNYPKDKLEIIVVDDFSEDKTAEVVKSIAKSTDMNVRCVSGRPLPKGWIGKSNACMVGGLESTGEWIFFIDADTYSDPDMLTSVIKFAMDKDVDLLSFNPKQDMISTSEKCFLPGLFLAIASSMRFDKSNDPNEEDAIANGQAMLFKMESYREVGGHEIIASEISDDLAFAKVMKEKKYKIYWAFADKLMSTRMYTSTKEIWDGFSKNMNKVMECKGITDVVIKSLKSFLLAWGNIILIIISACLYMDGGNNLLLISLYINIVMEVILIIMYMSLAKELYIPIIYGIVAPLGITMQSLLIIKSYILSKQKNIMWKGRKI